MSLFKKRQQKTGYQIYLGYGMWILHLILFHFFLLL